MSERVDVISGLIDISGNKIGQKVVQSIEDGPEDLNIIYAGIGSGKSTLIQQLTEINNELIYFPFDHIYDDAQEADLGLTKPFATKEHFQIMSDYWLRRLILFREQLKRSRIKGRIIADVPELRCQSALGTLASGELMTTQIFPMIRGFQNIEKVTANRAEVETHSNSALKEVIALQGLAVPKINTDSLIFRNVTGLKWRKLMRADEARICREVEDWYQEGVIDHPRTIPLPEQFTGLDPISKRVLESRIIHMQHDIDSFGFDLESNPILINP